MEEIIKRKIVLKKYFICLVGLLLLVILLIIKPAVNNTVTQIYFYASLVVVCFLSIVLPKYYFYDNEKLFGIIFNISDFFSLFIVACCLFQAIFVFGYFKADVDGLSMFPTLNDSDVLVVRSTKKVTNFDIIILEYDEEINGGYSSVFVEEDELLVKRLIAKGGDTCWITNGILYLNGKPVAEDYVEYDDYPRSRNINLSDYLGDGVYYDSKDGYYRVMQGYFFVLGDNRDGSADSRSFGLFKEEQLVGRLAYRINSLFDWEKIK